MLSIKRLCKICLLISLANLSHEVYAQNIDSDWYEPGVEVTQPDVWSNAGVMITDTLGRPAPTAASHPCILVRQCFSNGNCIMRQVCS